MSTELTIQEGRETIAKFMGWKRVGNRFEKENTDEAGNYYCHSIKTDQFNYDSNWSLLMSVVEKIEAMDVVDDFRIEIQQVVINAYISSDVKLYCIVPYKCHGSKITKKIEAVYLAVVQFIQWYTNQNK